MPAALYKAMGGFATNGVNMTQLESYQRGGTFAATEFYADVEGQAGRPGAGQCAGRAGFPCEMGAGAGDVPAGSGAGLGSGVRRCASCYDQPLLPTAM